MTEPGPFSVRTVTAIIAVGVFAFAAFFVLSAYAPELRQGNDGGAHALSKSAVGYAGLVKLLEAQGTPVVIGRTEGARAGAGLIVLTPPLQADARKVREAIQGQGPPVLIVLPKWDVSPDPRRPGWVRNDGRIQDPALRRAVVGWLSSAGFMFARSRSGQEEQAVILRAAGVEAASTPAGRIKGLQTLITTSEAIEPRLSYKGVVLGRLVKADRTVFILSDPDFLNTQGLAEIETARAALTILEDTRTGLEPIVFDVTLNGLAGGRSLLKLAVSPPFLAATLCAAVAAALAGWQAAVRWGPRAEPERAVAFGKRALADNAAALIRLSGREHRMADRYAAVMEAAVARETAAPVGERTADWMDGLTTRRQGLPLWSVLRTEAKAVRTRDALLSAARRIHHWRMEVGRGH